MHYILDIWPEIKRARCNLRNILGSAYVLTFLLFQNASFWKK